MCSIYDVKVTDMARCIPVKVLSQSPVNVSYIKSSEKAEKKRKKQKGAPQGMRKQLEK